MDAAVNCRARDLLCVSPPSAEHAQGGALCRVLARTIFDIFRDLVHAQKSLRPAAPRARVERRTILYYRELYRDSTLWCRIFLALIFQIRTDRFHLRARRTGAQNHPRMLVSCRRQAC